MRKALVHIFTLLTLVSWGQTRVDVGVQDFEEDPSGTVHFDLVLECSREDTAFVGFADLVFTADWSQFTSPSVSVSSLSNGKSRSGNTSINPGFIRFGIQNNSESVIYTFDPKFIDSQSQFNDNVLALDNGTTYAFVHIEITGYTGIDDPALEWVTTGADNEYVSSMYTFSTRVPKFVTEETELRFEDFPTLGSPRLNLTVFLEGPYDSGLGEMTTDLNTGGLIPLNNPYSGAPWNYTGGDSVLSIPNTDVVDWVLVEIRETNNANNANGSTSVGKRAGFVLKNGSIVDLDGSSYLEFDNTEFDESKKQFVVIYHRNHLAIMSADSLTYNDSVPPIARWEYDFTTSVSQIYGGSNGAKDISGVSMMIAGDGDSDGNVFNNDYDFYWSVYKGQSGYLKADFNCDGNVFNDDFDFNWEINKGKSEATP